MKYTKYLIRGEYIHLEQFETDNQYHKFPFTFAAIFVATMLFVMIIAMIPVTFTFDEYRNVRYHLIKYERKHHVIDNVLITVTSGEIFRIINSKQQLIFQTIGNELKIIPNGKSEILSNYIERNTRHIRKLTYSYFDNMNKQNEFTEDNIRTLIIKQIIDIPKRISLSA
jgi:hypothetical protein